MPGPSQLIFQTLDALKLGSRSQQRRRSFAGLLGCHLPIAVPGWLHPYRAGRGPSLIPHPADLDPAAIAQEPPAPCPCSDDVGLALVAHVAPAVNHLGLGRRLDVAAEPA